MSGSFYVFLIQLGLVLARLDLSPNITSSEAPVASDDPDAMDPDKPFECNSTETSFHADPKDCHSYYICYNGTFSHHTCPVDMAYHCEMNLCISDLYTPNCRPPVQCDQNGFKADPKDCTKFYQCSNGHPHHMECPKGTRFDPVSVRCSANMPCLIKSKHTSNLMVNLANRRTFFPHLINIRY